MNDTVEEQLCFEIKTILLAGHETSAAMLTWSLMELTRNSEALQKVLHTCPAHNTCCAIISHFGNAYSVLFCVMLQLLAMLLQSSHYMACRSNKRQTMLLSQQPRNPRVMLQMTCSIRWPASR